MPEGVEIFEIFMKYGYARVDASNPMTLFREELLGLQEQLLTWYGVEHICREIAPTPRPTIFPGPNSTSKMSRFPQRDILIAKLSEGDELVCYDYTTLGENDHLSSLRSSLSEKGIHIVELKYMFNNKIFMKSFSEVDKRKINSILNKIKKKIKPRKLKSLGNIFDSKSKEGFRRVVIQEVSKKDSTQLTSVFRRKSTGRPPAITAETIKKLQPLVADPSTNIKKLCEEHHITRSVLYRTFFPDGGLRPLGERIIQKSEQEPEM